MWHLSFVVLPFGTKFLLRIFRFQFFYEIVIISPILISFAFFTPTMSQQSINTDTPNNFFLIDIFRFVAASLVLLVHLSYIFNVPTIWDAFASSAVSWFFIVSGFILSYRYPNLTLSDLRLFYALRFARIYPAYLFSLLFAMSFMGVGYFHIGDNLFTQIGRPVIGTYDLPHPITFSFWADAATKHLFFLQLFSSVDCLKYLFDGPLWSVVNEVFFYLLFPLLLPLARSLNKAKHIIMAFIACYVLQYALIQLFLPSTATFDWFTLNTPVYTNPLVRWVEFFMGLLLYRAYLIMPNIKTIGRILLLALSIASYFFSLFLLPSVSQEYALFFLMTPSTNLLVLSLVYINTSISAQMSRFFMLLGGASYVLYCIHFPFMELIYFFGGKKWIPDNSILILSIYGVTVLLSIFIHLLLEKNVRGVLIKQLLK